MAHLSHLTYQSFPWEAYHIKLYGKYDKYKINNFLFEQEYSLGRFTRVEKQFTPKKV